MSRRKESISYILVHDVPWWVSAVLAVVVYKLMRSVAPTLWQDNLVMKDIMKAMPSCPTSLLHQLSDVGAGDQEDETCEG
jgi:hypothetical protein